MKFHQVLISVCFFLGTSLLIVGRGQHAFADNLVLKGSEISPLFYSCGSYPDGILTGISEFNDQIFYFFCIPEESEEGQIASPNQERIDQHDNVPLKITTKPLEVLHMIGSIIAPTTDFSP